MHVIMTRVKLKPGCHEQCAELFRETNPDVISGEKDWLGAQMLFDQSTNVVTVLATWQDTKSYERLSTSLRFQHTMRKFGELFASAPEVSANTVLVEMTSQSE